MKTAVVALRPEALAIAQTPSPITNAKIGKVFHVDWDFSLKSRVAENKELTDTTIWLL
jgi:hypothetical protein